MTITAPAAAASEQARRRPFNLGFHTRISFPTGQAAAGLRDGIELFRAGERLGYDRGWVYQRHFDNYMAAPMVYLPVVAQHTQRIGLGTAIIGMRYEAPVLMAEQAGTADLLAGGRLQLGLGTGMGGFNTAFGQGDVERHAQARATAVRFMQGVRGETIGLAEPESMLPADLELRVTPYSPTLAARIWYGGGSIESAEWVAGQGLGLMTSTILTGRYDDFAAQQARLIEAYQAAYVGQVAPKVSVSRSILPATTPDQARLYREYDHQRKTLGPAASRPNGALPADLRTRLPEMTVSDSLHGDPAAIVAALADDPAVAMADELICFLPPAFDLEHNLRLIEDIIATVAVELGWQPAGDRDD